MAKHIYHLPQEKIKAFIGKNEGLFLKILKDKEMFAFYKNFGMSFYVLHVREFLKAYKIDKDFTFANRSFNHLLGDGFLKNFYRVLDLEKYKTLYGNQKEVFFIFIYLLELKDKELANIFIQKVFTHFFALAPKSPKKNYIQIAKSICKTKGVILKESYTQKPQDNVRGGGGNFLPIFK